MVYKLGTAVAIHAVRNWNPVEFFVSPGSVVFIERIPIADAQKFDRPFPSSKSVLDRLWTERPRWDGIALKTGEIWK
jgi:hypothetical protein